MALAIHKGLSNKHVSERHYYASQKKSTIGEVAAKFRKQGDKIYAKELLALYKDHYGKEPEWHHSGFYKVQGGKTMGRTFFLSDNEIEEIKTLVSNFLIKKNTPKQTEIDFEIYGFYYIWDYDYSGKYGKKRNHKVLQSFKGSMNNKPKNFTECSEEQYLNVCKFEGKKYYGWDEPNLYEF